MRKFLQAAFFCFASLAIGALALDASAISTPKNLGAGLEVIFKDFQFLGSDSQVAGLAAKAVWEVAPDKFYDWHKAMYDKQDSENSGWGKKEDILALIKSRGIDAIKVEGLMTSKAVPYQKALDADKYCRRAG